MSCPFSMRPSTLEEWLYTLACIPLALEAPRITVPLLPGSTGKARQLWGVGDPSPSKVYLIQVFGREMNQVKKARSTILYGGQHC